jgi:general stress protein 26
MDTQAGRGEAVRKLAELIEGIEVAMRTTVDESGALRSRPMMTQQVGFDGDLWFFTKASDPKVGEIEREHSVNVSYSNPDKQHYVSMSGKARLVRDRAKIEELWNPAYKAWFPEGLDDPEVALLEVTVEQAEYWDTPTSTVVHLVGLAKALVTGETYRPGENEKVDLK